MSADRAKILSHPYSSVTMPKPRNVEIGSYNSVLALY